MRISDWSSDVCSSDLLLSDISCNALQQCLRLVLLGEKVFPSQLLSMWTSSNAKARPAASAPARGAQNLSEREREILECLVQGASNKLIADRKSTRLHSSHSCAFRIPSSD